MPKLARIRNGQEFPKNFIRSMMKFFVQLSHVIVWIHILKLDYTYSWNSSTFKWILYYNIPAKWKNKHQICSEKILPLLFSELSSSNWSLCTRGDRSFSLFSILVTNEQICYPTLFLHEQKITYALHMNHAKTFEKRVRCAKTKGIIKYLKDPKAPNYAKKSPLFIMTIGFT